MYAQFEATIRKCLYIAFNKNYLIKQSIKQTWITSLTSTGNRKHRTCQLKTREVCD